EAAKDPDYAPFVAQLCVLRGFDVLSAMTILTELGDLRRVASAPQLMAAVGLVPSEYSTGDKTRRFSITKTGNAHVRRRATRSAPGAMALPASSARRCGDSKAKGESSITTHA